VQEIARFQETLRSIANLQLTPDLDDGVLQSIAPLHPLVPWSEAKRAWQELAAGKYALVDDVEADGGAGAGESRQRMSAHACRAVRDNRGQT
jgi:hypothetical protein